MEGTDWLGGGKEADTPLLKRKRGTAEGGGTKEERGANMYKKYSKIRFPCIASVLNSVSLAGIRRLCP